MAGNHFSTNTAHKITMAWAISECALGGFLHAIQSPFTGLLVGGLSVIFISLLAYHSAKPTAAIFQALIFVLGVKMAVSPHSPLGAYFAVSTQAFLGITFFKLVPKFSFAAILLGIFSLVTSAVQKILILTILFGVGLWQALDEYATSIASKMATILALENFSISEWLFGLYIGVYAIGGLFIGIIASRIPSLLQNRAGEFDAIISNFEAEPSVKNDTDIPKKKWRIWPLVIAFIALGITVQWILFSAQSAFDQLLRTVGVISVWLLILRPLFKWVLQRSLRKQQASLQTEIADVQTRIPILIEFAKFAWKTRKQTDRNQLINFITIYVYYAVYKL